jgi:hypothetical protein
VIQLFIAISQKVNYNNLEQIYALIYQWLTVDRIADLEESPQL